MGIDSLLKRGSSGLFRKCLFLQLGFIFQPRSFVLGQEPQPEEGERGRGQQGRWLSSGRVSYGGRDGVKTRLDWEMKRWVGK